MAKTILNLAATAAALSACLMASACNRSPKVTVEDAWVRMPAVEGQAAAGYFTAKSTGPDDVLIAVTAPGTRIEMHETMSGSGSGSGGMSGSMSSMKPLELAFFDKGELVFRPGGKHLMIYNLEGQRSRTVPLTFRFRKVGAVTVTAKLVDAGDEHDAQ
jgi:copper(I)-binding protein